MRIRLLIAGAVSRAVKFPERTIFFMELQLTLKGGIRMDHALNLQEDAISPGNSMART